METAEIKTAEELYAEVCRLYPDAASVDVQHMIQTMPKWQYFDSGTLSTWSIGLWSESNCAEGTCIARGNGMTPQEAIDNLTFKAPATSLADLRAEEVANG